METHEDVPVFPAFQRSETMDTPTGGEEINGWIEGLTDFAWIFDLQFRSIWIDPRVSTRSLHSAEEMIGRTAWETFPELVDTIWAGELQQAVAEHAPRRFEFLHPLWKRWLDCRVFPGKERVSVLARDTTPHKDLEIGLEEARQELESFSYSITHDMRAPLRAMQSFAHILQQECDKGVGPEAHDYIRRIIAGSERLDRLIQDGLAYSQLSRAYLPLSPIDLRELLNELLESYPEFQEPHASIAVTSTLPVVEGNAAALTQCVANLIDNGIKFSKPRQHPEIEIWAESRGSRTRIHIKDQGIGIDPAYHDKIFSMFYQHDPRYDGTGIGLVVVRKAAEKMKGRVGVESELAKGSVFYLELNLAH